MDILRLHFSVNNSLFRDIIPFWIKNGLDKNNGGIFTCLDRTGDIYSYDKSVWMQGRTAYIFYTLCLQYGTEPLWKEMADSCISFLDNHCIDSSDGRMYFSVTAEGKPLRKRRYIFSESFYTIAHARRHALTGDNDSLVKARSYYNLMLNIYDNSENDPYKITPKFISSTRESKALAYPMILLNVTVVMSECDKENESQYKNIAKRIIQDIRTFRHEETGLMLENILSKGERFFESSVGRIVNPGHSMELSWFLADSAAWMENSELLLESEDIFWKAYYFGKDEKYGGILYFKDLFLKPVEAYEHDMKLWWVHTEALTAAIKFYDYTKKDIYLELFDELYDYSFKHFADTEYGEWFGYLRRDGLPTEPPCKGHTYKGPFHVIRMLSESERVLSKLVKKPFGCDNY